MVRELVCVYLLASTWLARVCPRLISLLIYIYEGIHFFTNKPDFWLRHRYVIQIHIFISLIRELYYAIFSVFFSFFKIYLIFFALVLLNIAIFVCTRRHSGNLHGVYCDCLLWRTLLSRIKLVCDLSSSDASLLVSTANHPLPARFANAKMSFSSAFRDGERKIDKERERKREKLIESSTSVSADSLNNSNNKKKKQIV